MFLFFSFQCAAAAIFTFHCVLNAALWHFSVLPEKGHCCVFVSVLVSYVVPQAGGQRAFLVIFLTSFATSFGRRSARRGFKNRKTYRRGWLL